MPPAPRPYHHGNLSDALIDAGVELAREGGPEAVVVREASRRVGVSHNAAYRHFADRDLLLKRVCERCMAQLALVIERRVGEVPDDPADAAAAEWARLAATGAGYIEFAVSEPGWFRTAFAVPASLEHLGPGEGAGASGLNPYELLVARLDALVAVGALPPERREGAETSAWASVHGLSTLLTEGPLRSLPDAERELATARLLQTIARGL